MPTPFENVENIVKKLRVEHEQLIKELPGLREKKKFIIADIDELNKSLVSKQATLDKLIEAIASRTKAYNGWQEEQLKELAIAKAIFKKQVHESENELATREAKLREDQALVTKQAASNTAKAESITKDQQDIDAQRQTNNAWTGKLSKKEAIIATTAKSQADTKASLDSREQALNAREIKITEAEKVATENLNASENDRKIARQILANSKEKIADNDARTDELDRREASVKGRESKLRSQEAALNDRRNVMISNGMLEA